MRSAGAVVAVLTALRVRYRLNAEALLQVCGGVTVFMLSLCHACVCVR